jgi:hypothetical protein
MFSICILISSGYAFAQPAKQAIGLRAGSPLSITYKRYLGNDRAVEFMIGSAPTKWYKVYYKNSFDAYSKYDDLEYVSHTVRSSVYLQARYLFHYHIEEEIDGILQWYWGLGAMFKGATIHYRFREFDDPLLFSDTKNDIDLGLEAPIGLEYTFEDVPITLFGELSLFFELADRPATIRGPFIGLGARYNF